MKVGDKVYFNPDYEINTECEKIKKCFIKFSKKYTIKRRVDTVLCLKEIPGMYWAQERFITEKELHNKNFNNAVDEVLK